MVKNVNDVQKFWSEHPMAYHSKKKVGSKEFFEEVDSRFKRMAWFGQKKGERIFSNYINYNTLKGKKVLEIGYGIGTVANDCIGAGAIYTGIDLSKSHHKLCAQRFKGTNAKFILGNAEELPFKDGEFDYVISWGVLHHTPKTNQAINEAARVLRKGGKSFMMLYHRASMKYWIHNFIKFGLIKGMYFKYWDMQEFTNHVTDNHDKNKDGCPLARTYTRKELKKIYSFFSKNKITVTGSMWEAEAFPSGKHNWAKILPFKFKKFLLERWGWFLIIQSIK